MIRTLLIAITTALAACIFQPSDTLAHPAWGIAVDPQGQVYFTDLTTVWKINAQGKVSIFRAGGNWHTHDLTLDEAGNVYGADNSYDPATQRFFSAVWRMTPAGVFSYLLPRTDKPPNGTSIWRDGDGNMYHVATFPGRELLVLKRTTNGEVTTLVGSSRAAREFRQSVPYSAGGMAIGRDGVLYFIHGANVSKIATSGGALTTLARDVVVDTALGGSTARSSLFGIAVDAQGNIFVADYGNRRVLKISPDGKSSTLIRSEGSWFPTGVATKNRELYILEESHTPAHQPVGTQVRKLSPDGTVRVLATIEHGKVLIGSSPEGEVSSGDKSATTAETRKSVPYILIGLSLGASLIAIAAWLLWRRSATLKSEQLPPVGPA